MQTFALSLCLIALSGCFDSSSKNNNESADKSKGSVQMQSKDVDNK